MTPERWPCPGCGQSMPHGQQCPECAALAVGSWLERRKTRERERIAAESRAYYRKARK